MREAAADWQRQRADQLKTRERYPGSNEMMAFSKGPRVDIALLSCPAPFVINAECRRIVGGMNGYGTIGCYLCTPWRVYVISEAHTWLS
jgi:hypothetical protein